MATPTRQFNGTTLTFAAGAVVQVTGITFTENGVEIDTSDIDDAITLYEVGQTDINLNVTIVGAKSGALAVGDLGAVVLTWTDGTVDNITDSVITARAPAGTKNGAIATSYTMRPAHADVA